MLFRSTLHYNMDKKENQSLANPSRLTNSTESVGGNLVSNPKKELSFLEMVLSLDPQGFAQFHIGERHLPLMPYKPGLKT